MRGTRLCRATSRPHASSVRIRSRNRRRLFRSRRPWPARSAGTWVGRPGIATIDYAIELEFTRNADGALVGKLIGTTLPKEEKIDKPLRRFTITDRRMNWEFPNTQS